MIPFLVNIRDILHGEELTVAYEPLAKKSRDKPLLDKGAEKTAKKMKAVK